MTRPLRSLLVVALIASGACAHFRVAPRDLASSTVEHKRRVHVIAWGALESRVEPPNCHGSGLATVTMKVTALDALAAVATLGFWNTATVEWTCAKARGGRRP